VKPADVRAFVERDWAAIQASKRAYWADRYRDSGWRAAWDAADALWIDARHVLPVYPTPASRAEDLADHLALCATLDRAARAFTRR